MKYAVHTNALSSVYQDSTEKSKQTSQLLFGEVCLIKSERDRYHYIENFHDKHNGWVLKDSLYLIDESVANQIKDQQVVRVFMPLVDAFNTTNKSIVRLPAGSLISNYNTETSKFSVGDIEYQIHSSFLTHLPYGDVGNLPALALSFLNTPFMYGGKSVLGIDSAGFVQLIFSLCGFKIPRSIGDQSKVGELVNSIEDLKIGDLIFIENEKKLYNVLIYLGDNQVIGIQEKVVVMDLSNININVSTYIIRRLV